MFFGNGKSCNLVQIEASAGWVLFCFFLIICWVFCESVGEKCNPSRAQELIWVN